VIVSFIRHGSTGWNESGRMQGRRDVPLSASGRADVAGWRLPSADAGAHWVSSPLARAVQTARILGSAEPQIEPALTEMAWGAWEGWRLDELRERCGDAFVRNERLGLDFRPPGGESPRDVIARVSPWLARLAAADRPCVAVTHNGVLRALLAFATGWDMTGTPPVRLRAATLHRFRVAPGPSLSVVACNVPLLPDATRLGPTPPSPAAAAP
jgi:probable phosphoglycerate mutase